MSHRLLGTLLAVVLPVLCVPVPVAGQEPTTASETWTSAQTPWGDPDLQGTWTNSSLTPLQRPVDVAGKEVLTEEEWAERDAFARLSDDYSPQGPVGWYNDFWLEQGELSRRTSLIVDPPDGRLPPVTSAEQERQSKRTDSYTRAHLAHGMRFESWEDFNVYDRCITRGLPGAMMPGFYNHNYLILQTPDYVAIAVEMIHDTRIIPLDGRSHLSPTVRLWLGDSRGHWEGNTLVVETTNFNDKVQRRHGSSSFAGHRAPLVVFGGDEQLRLVERFTRTDADTIDYRFTVTDPTVWEGPWTAAIPMTMLEWSLYEYACHEGNYAVPNALRGSRAEEDAAAHNATSGSR